MTTLNPANKSADPSSDSRSGLTLHATDCPIYLDPRDAAHQKRQRAQQLHLVRVPLTRLAGFTALLGLVFLHNGLVLDAFSWPAFFGLALALEGYALLAWLLLSLLYERSPRVNIALVLLYVDIAFFALIVYATGGERSWLFFILTVRSADVAFFSARQLVTFAHASVMAYVLLLLYLAGPEQRSIAWPVELVKIVAIYIVSLYFASTRRIVERLRARTSAAVRMARDLIRQLDDAKKHAEAFTEAKSRFVASVSHELRTPLNAIIGLTHLIEGPSLTLEQQRSFASLKTSARVLLEMVNEVLDFSKIEAGKLALEQVPFQLREVLGDVAQGLEVRAREKGLDLGCEVAADVPDDLVGDPVRLRQVLTNLVDNGLKFTERGEVTVRVRVLSGEADHVSLRFGVSDTGIGIREEDQPRIFDAFAQADVSTTRRHGGTGLGLAIASRLVRLMGGRLELESEPGRGSTFDFTASFGLGEARTPSARRAELAPPPETFRPLRVLVVEDNTLNAEVARRLLQRRGHSVVVEMTGQAGVEAFEREAFDAVLMDVQMPELDGLTAVAALRQRERSCRGHVPIVAVTAHATADDRERCLAGGMDAYLPKPIDPLVLIETIERLAVPSPLDHRPLLAEAHGNPERQRELARLFLEHAPRQIADIRIAVGRRDRRALAAAAHRLSGSVANFACPAALATAHRLEAMGDLGDLTGVDDAAAALEREVAGLAAALSALVGDDASTDSAKIATMVTKQERETGTTPLWAQ